MRLFILLFTVLILITACSPEDNKTPKIAEGARQALDKAKMIDTTTEQATDAARQSIDEQTQ